MGSIWPAGNVNATQGVDIIIVGSICGRVLAAWVGCCYGIGRVSSAVSTEGSVVGRGWTVAAAVAEVGWWRKGAGQGISSGPPQ